MPKSFTQKELKIRALRYNEIRNSERLKEMADSQNEELGIKEAVIVLADMFLAEKSSFKTLKCTERVNTQNGTELVPTAYGRTRMGVCAGGLNGCVGETTPTGKYKEPLCRNCIEKQERDPALKKRLIKEILSKDSTRDMEQLEEYSNGTLTGILMAIISKEKGGK